MVTIDSGAESAWPMSPLKEIPTLKIVREKKRFVPAKGQDTGHYGRKEVTFGVTKPPSCGKARHREGERGALPPECERRQDSEKKKTGRSYVIDIDGN